VDVEGRAEGKAAQPRATRASPKTQRPELTLSILLIIGHLLTYTYT